MNTTKAQIIIETLRKYSEETKQVAHDLEKYDYRDEAAHWYDEYDPSLIEAAHPTLRDLHNRFAKDEQFHIPSKIKKLSKQCQDKIIW